MRSPYLFSDPRRPKDAVGPVVTVGNAPAMFRGNDHFAIQGAIDYVSRFGGGTVQVLSGEFILRNAVFLSSTVSLVGSPGSTVLRKAPSYSSALAEDQDWYAWCVAVRDPSGFAVGDGITLESLRIDEGRFPQASRHTIVAIEGHRLHLDSPPRLNHWTSHEARATSTHSLVEAQRASQLGIRDLIIEGDQAKSSWLDGNFGGAVFLHDCEDVRISGVTVRDFHGDAFSWQVSHDVVIEDCCVESVSSLGLHPGSGSQRPIMRGNTIAGCDTGIYWCWGVRHGLAENNRISNCSRHGISIGHRDTDNIIRGNHLSSCAEAAIFFRPERSPSHTAHRVTVEDNTISCPDAPSTSSGIVVSRGVEDAIIRGNHITIAPPQLHLALVIDPASHAQTESNVVENGKGITG